jgi:hypothetical protein
MVAFVAGFAAAALQPGVPGAFDRPIFPVVGLAISAGVGFAASKVDMTPLWAIGMWVPVLGLVGLGRICWRYAEVISAGHNPFGGGVVTSGYS